MSTATQGRAREYRVRDHLTDHGWLPIMRAAGSKGAADLLLAHPDHGPALFQVGTENKTLGPADRGRLLHAAAMMLDHVHHPYAGADETLPYLIGRVVGEVLAECERETGARLRWKVRPEKTVS